MRNCIVQYFVDPKLYSDPEYNSLSNEQDNFAKLSEQSFRAYAKKYKCDYQLITQPKLKYRHPTFERFDLWLDATWWKRYDQILYVDSDVFAMPGAPDVFAQYNNIETLKVCESNKFQNASCQEHYDQLQQGLLTNVDIEVIKQRGFQPGVFILNKHVVEKTKKWIEQYQTFDTHDGDILLWAVCNSAVGIERLSWKFNYKRAYYSDAPKIYFFHAAGRKKTVDHTKQRILSFLKRNGIELSNK